MGVAMLCKSIIPLPAICFHCGARFHSIYNKRDEAITRHVFNLTYPDTTVSFWCMQFNGDRKNGLSFSLTALNTFFFASNIRLVDFNNTGKSIPARANHRPSQLVKNSPRGLVAAYSENPLETKRTYSVFLSGNVPYCYEPHCQRGPSPFKDSPGSDSELSATRTANQTRS